MRTGSVFVIAFIGHAAAAVDRVSKFQRETAPVVSFGAVSLVQLRADAKKSERKLSAKDELITFHEVQANIFPKEWYSFGHVGRAGRYCGSPHFPDFNEDGFLDFFYHNHYKLDPVTGWDFGMHMGDPSSAPWYGNTSAKSLKRTESGDHDPSDTHGIAFLDIDRDGVLDLYISVGGGEGREGGFDHNAVLMWGEKVKSYVRFVGGRDVAQAAHVHNPDSRGRFTYFADFNHDGLLDMMFGNDVRVDNENAVGYLMYNEGNRKFKPDWSLMEYANSMILTDADGDGNADEFLINRRHCLPNETDSPEPTKKLLEFCNGRPAGTTVIYKYDTEKKMMKKLASEGAHEREFQDPGVSMQSGDFDGDGIADLAVLRRSRLTFYYSKPRKAGDWPIGLPNEDAIWEMHLCAGLGLRAADFDLDGKLELLVMCEEFGEHRLYKQNHDNHWYHVEAGLGDIKSKELPLLRQEYKDEACSFPGTLPFIEDFCAHLKSGKKIPDTTSNGISVVDFNNDGYMDVVLSHDWGTLMVMANEGGSNKFIALKLKGTVSNDYGIGATIVMKARNMGPDGNRTVAQFREINTASHETDWWGGRDDRIVFGLGEKGVPVEITVRWPGKGKQVQVVTDEDFMALHTNTMKDPLVVREPEHE